jgi:integrase
VPRNTQSNSLEDITASRSSTRKSRTKRPNGAGSYYQVRNGRFKAAIKDLTGNLRTKTFTREIDAQEWLVEQRRIRENGNSSYALRPKDSLAIFLKRYLDSREGSIKYNTMKSYRGSLARLTPLIGSINASKVTPRAIESAYTQMRAKNYQPGTLKAAHRLLSAAYKDAYRLGELPNNPMEKVMTPKGKCNPTKPIPQEDMEKIYLAAKKQSAYALARIDIGFTLGLRPGEVFGLCWSDIDFDAKLITIQRQVQYIPGKGRVFQSVKQDEIRVLPLTQKQLEILQEHRSIQDLEKGFWQVDEGLIFPSSIGTKKDESKDRKEFKELCKKAGVRQYQVYQMRKTCFTNLGIAGVDLATLKTFSGHKQTSTLLDSYVFSTSDSLNLATSKMDQIRPPLGD